MFEGELEGGLRGGGGGNSVLSLKVRQGAVMADGQACLL